MRHVARGDLPVVHEPWRDVALRGYIDEVLRNAEYDRGEVLDVVVAEAPDLPGCITQGDSYEGARTNLIDAIEVWVLSGIPNGENTPIVNGCRLAIAADRRRGEHAPALAGVRT